MLDLQPIKDRYENASPGNWLVASSDEMPFICVLPMGDNKTPKEHCREFIASSREDVAALVAAVERSDVGGDGASEVVL